MSTTMPALIVNGDVVGYYPPLASSIEFDNTSTTLSSTNVQDAIEELDATKVSKSGDTMTGKLDIDRQNGTTSEIGGSQIWLGNNITEGTDKNSRGVLRLYGKKAFYGEIYDDTGLTANRSYLLPNASGTLALNEQTVTMKIELPQQNVSHTISFSGSSVTRRPLGYILISGQDEIIPPIYFMVQGSGTVEISTSTISVSANDVGVTGGTGVINIPAGLGSNWGQISIYQYPGRLDGITITDT